MEDGLDGLLMLLRLLMEVVVGEDMVGVDIEVFSGDVSGPDKDG